MSINIKIGSKNDNLFSFVDREAAESYICLKGRL